MDADALRAFLEETFPAAVALGFDMEEVSEEGVRLTLTTGPRHLRPGGTVMGPLGVVLSSS